MLVWAASQGAASVPKRAYIGTFESLVNYYETHPDSPYHELRQAPARNYSYLMKRLMEAKGKRRVGDVVGGDVKRWYKELVEATSKGTAAYTMRVLRAILSFGASQRFRDCRDLREELRWVEFPAAAPRKETISYAQVLKFGEAERKVSKETGRDLRWMYLCLLFQFEMALRRRDVIGEWVRSKSDGSGIRGGRAGRKVWQDGATWANIDKEGVFSKLVSKTRDTSQQWAAHRIADYPTLAAELDRLPPERRIGPIVINDATGRPPTETDCRRWFRAIARKAGIPDEVQMMDARAGANSEAGESGATDQEQMALLTHTQKKTNQGYDRIKLVRSSSAAAKRQASRVK